jgi:hypothetical protein
MGLPTPTGPGAHPPTGPPRAEGAADRVLYPQCAMRFSVFATDDSAAARRFPDSRIPGTPLTRHPGPRYLRVLPISAASKPPAGRRASGPTEKVTGESLHPSPPLCPALSDRMLTHAVRDPGRSRRGGPFCPTPGSPGGPTPRIPVVLGVSLPGDPLTGAPGESTTGPCSRSTPTNVTAFRRPRRLSSGAPRLTALSRPAPRRRTPPPRGTPAWQRAVLRPRRVRRSPRRRSPIGRVLRSSEFPATPCRRVGGVVGLERGPLRN